MTNTKTTSRAMRQNQLEQESRLQDGWYAGCFTCPHGVDVCGGCIGSCVHRCDACMVEDMERRQAQDPFAGLDADTRVTADPDRRGYRR